jgi:hypothetical protein
MTYLFLGISVGLILAVSEASFLGLAVIGGIVLVFILLLEGSFLAKREYRQEIVYDNIDLVHLARRSDLLEDLRIRTGLAIDRITVEEIDLVKAAAKLTVYYHGGEASAAAAQGPRAAFEAAGYRER